MQSLKLKTKTKVLICGITNTNINQKYLVPTLTCYWKGQIMKNHKIISLGTWITYFSLSPIAS